MNTKLLQRYVKLDRIEARLSSRLKRIQAEMKKCEETVLDELAEAGFDNVTIGDHVIYQSRQLVVNTKSGMKEQAIQVLKDLDLGEYVEEGFSTGSFKSYISEELKAGREIPEAIKECFHILPSWRARVRKK